MIGLTYAAAPFYSAFCRATGYEGTPQQVKANTDAEGHRILRVGFDANVAPGLEWSLEPESESIRVRTGKTVTVFFRVRNLSDKPTEGHATFNVTPEVSGEIFQQDLVLLLHRRSISARTKAPNGRWCSSSIRRSRRTRRWPGSIRLRCPTRCSLRRPRSRRLVVRPIALGPRDDHNGRRTMTDAALPDRPGFHLVDPSPWPLVGAAFAFLSAFGLILFMHGSSFGARASDHRRRGHSVHHGGLVARRRLRGAGRLSQHRLCVMA